MNKLRNLLAIAFVAVTVAAYAGDCAALSGRYIIGKGENADFSSFNDAVNALKCGGVAGPVIFAVESGNYNEKLLITSIPCASAMNTVSFQATADAILTYATSDATVILNNVSYVSFENITIDHKTSTYGNALRVDGRTTNIRFKGVVFNGVEVARPGANNATVYFTSTSPKSDIAFEDCEVNNGSVGIYKNGMSADAMDAKTSISGTLFFNQFEAGLVLSNEDAPVINSNVVSSVSTYKDFKAITLDNVADNVLISNNIVNAATGSVGLVMNNCIAQREGLGQINNNSIAVGGSSDVYGILLTGTTDNQVINFNRVKLTLPGGVQASDQAYYKNAGSGYNVNMMNNIFYDLNTGGYTILGNTYKDAFNQLPAQSNPSLTVSANGLMIEKVTPIK